MCWHSSIDAGVGLDRAEYSLCVGTVRLMQAWVWTVPSIVCQDKLMLNYCALSDVLLYPRHGF